MDFLDYIYINKSFYTLKVRLWFFKEILSQVYINKKECYNVIGKIAERDNNSNMRNTKIEIRPILSYRGSFPSHLVRTVKLRVRILSVTDAAALRRGYRVPLNT